MKDVGEPCENTGAHNDLKDSTDTGVHKKGLNVATDHVALSYALTEDPPK